MSAADAGRILARPELIDPVGGRSGRRAAVLGFPVTHSRSPDLHLAAYHALGLDDWSYTRIECTAEDLPGLIADADATWVGFSVTMPGKLAALSAAAECTERARLVGSANTLVRTTDGWRADCTDIDGMVGALAEIGVDPASVGEQMPAAAVLVGAGGTALPSVAALAAVGITEITVIARSAHRAESVLALAHGLGMHAVVLPFDDTADLRALSAAAAVVVSTVPAAAAAPIAEALAHAPRVVDVIYDPWPTPLAAAVSAAGGQVVGGLVMLLNQAFSQVEQFTGYPAPREAMAHAL